MTKIEIQYGSESTVTSDVEKRVKKELKDNDIKLTTLNTLNIYFKPENGEIYYVAYSKDGKAYHNIDAIKL